MKKKLFNCVLGKDYHIINNNVDNMTYFLQDGNDVVLVINLLNKLYDENEQLKKAEKINMEYAEQIVEENKKLRIAKNDLRIENEQLKQEVIIYKKLFQQQVQRCTL